MVMAAVALWVMVSAPGRPALAQAPTPAPAAEQTGAAPAAVTADEINTVARELWCPLCSGVRLDSCELKACDQMKDEIGIMLAEGQDTPSIIDYFVQQYGPQVLGQPPLSGFNWLAWVLPVIVVVGGAVFVFGLSRRMVRTAPAAGPAESSAPLTDYDRKLDEELRRYD